MNTMSPLEMDLVSIFFYTKTVDGCRAGLMTLDILERNAPTVEESDIIKDMMDFLMVKGNMLIVEERQ